MACFVIPESTHSVSYRKSAAVSLSHLLSGKPADLPLIKAREANRFLLFRRFSFPSISFWVCFKLLQLQTNAKERCIVVTSVAILERAASI